jgi:Putative zincin peptidase
MSFSVEDLDDQKRFRLFLTIPYKDLIQFVFDYLKKKSILMFLFWSFCLLFLCLTVQIRIKVAGYFPVAHIIFHSFIGLIILPLICIPLHELLHIIPYYLSGARNIRVGMDLKQYLFYVTAHRYVATPLQFRIVAWFPFIIISTVLTILIFLLPGLWKWSLSLFLFAHATMCAGDFALLNLYHLNRNKKIYTWDDAEKKEAYFYEKIS